MRRFTIDGETKIPMLPDTMKCYLVRNPDRDVVEAGMARRALAELPAGDVLIRVAFSALNYKDALAAHGHPGVVKSFPHVPGIDAAGTVVESSSADVRVGQQVLVTTYELGDERWGGWAEYIRVPADWVVPLPEGLSLEESMILGTAGMTAALCVRALQQHNVRPESGPVVVTGATGGVGVMAVKLLAKLGYTVVAASGKRDKWAWLQELGASQVVSREDMVDDTHRPLLSARWAGAVDTVGGRTLATLLKSTRPDGCVTACGLVGGSTLPTSVFPFILRGVVLAGICAAWCPRALRLEVWHQLAGAWRLDKLSDLAIRVPLEEIGGYVTQILAGEVAGRVVVDLRNAAAESHGCHTVTCGQ